MFRIDTRSFASYAAAVALTLLSTTMMFAATSVPSVEALSASAA